ncbi:MAG: hypothetical protein WCT12_17825 [Verrucomicrobiota bacterium]
MPELAGMLKTNITRAAPPTQPAPILQPTFVRLPRPGQRDLSTGLSRTAIYSLLAAGKVRSVSMRQKGVKRGIRLIDFKSLIAAINSSEAA